MNQSQTHYNNNLSIVEQLKREHKEIKIYFKQYEDHFLNKNFVEAQKWFNQFAWALTRHMICEEIVVYPWFEQNSMYNINHNRNEHQEVKENLHKLDAMEVTNPSSYPIAKKTFEAVFAHIAHEEEHELPELEKKATLVELKRLDEMYMLYRKIVPSEPHPLAPNTPVLATLAGLLLTPYDKIKEAFKDYPTEEETKYVLIKELNEQNQQHQQECKEKDHKECGTSSSRAATSSTDRAYHFPTEDERKNVLLRE
jgi:hypothetical protein